MKSGIIYFLTHTKSRQFKQNTKLNGACSLDVPNVFSWHSSFFQVVECLCSLQIKLRPPLAWTDISECWEGGVRRSLVQQVSEGTLGPEAALIWITLEVEDAHSDLFFSGWLGKERKETRHQEQLELYSKEITQRQ